MAKTGDVLENPINGDRLTFLKTTADSAGEVLELELVFRPGAPTADPHLHTKQEERFDILSGTALVRAGKRVRVMAAGESVVFPAGTAHGIRNDGQDDLRFRATIRPALQTEAFLEAVFSLARDGKVTKEGFPNFLRGAMLLRRFPETLYLAALPIGFQRATIPLAAALGRLLGY